MDVKKTVKCMAALAHTNRFEVFRALVQAGRSGMTPGVLSEQIGISASNLSFHLKELVNADLVEACNDGRYIIYSAKYETLDEVFAFITESCCEKDPSFRPEPEGATSTAVNDTTTTASHCAAKGRGSSRR